MCAKTPCFHHSTNLNTRPRTKQTAKKMAGVPAPSVSLSHLQLSQPVKKRKINGEASLDSVEVDVEVKEQFEVVHRGHPVEPGMVSEPIQYSCLWSLQKQGKYAWVLLMQSIFCDGCIEFPNDSSQSFVCPSCHIREGPKKWCTKPYVSLDA
jgi:hypothetical protein